jgi:hypothetical protein
MPGFDETEGVITIAPGICEKIADQAIDGCSTSQT